MPLTEKVSFTATLQGASAVQIPKLIRSRFKLECDQPLRVGVNFLDLHKGWQFFYAKIRNDGRLTIPKLVLNLFGDDEQPNLAGYVLEITLEPA
ncbi:MAG: hypothetical protein ABSF44_13440 [Candidatus Bathyarchaeia archaeon]|jgi:hypothetical protein